MDPVPTTLIYLGTNKRNQKVNPQRPAKRLRAAKSRPISLANGNEFQPTRRAGERFSGEDLALHLSTDNHGFVVNRSVNPVKWTNTRLASIAACYSLYRPVSIELSWIPSCAATTPGSMIYGVSYAENLITNEGFLGQQQLLSTCGSKLISVNSRHSWKVPFQHSPQKWFYVDSDHDVDSEPCRIMALFADTASPAEAYGLGFLTIKYVYQFSEPIASQTIRKEIEFGGSTLPTVGVEQEIVMNLDDQYEYTGINFSELGEAMKPYLSPGIMYGLSAVVGAVGKYMLTRGGSPILAAAATAATAVSGMLEYTLKHAVLPQSLMMAELTHENGKLVFTHLNQEPTQSVSPPKRR